MAVAACVAAACTQQPDPIYETEKITWAQHIAPIIFENCSPCHRPGESGPFDLLTYHDAIKRISRMRFAVETGYMPPWPADPSYSHFANERCLSKNEKQLLLDWIASGTLRGDSTREPAAPVFYTGSYFGKPDLVIPAVSEVKIKGNGTDAFMVMKFPYQIARDTIIDFVEFVPDRRKLIHHVNGHLVSYDEKREFDHMNGEWMSEDVRSQVIDIYKRFHIPYTDGAQPSFPMLTPNVVYYLPGYIPPVYPKEAGGYRIKKNGAFLLNNIHYGPSKNDTVDRSHINVFYRKDKIQRPVSETQLGTFGISKIEPEFVLPANEVKTFYTHTTLSKPISLLSVNPHMHLTGTKYLAFALSPKGDTIPLIRINKWDFRWQYYYTFKHPVVLEAGSSIHVYGTFDNTDKNPLNPFFPPRVIGQGNGVESMKTTEEMFQFIFTYMNYRAGDEKLDLERKIH